MSATIGTGLIDFSIAKSKGMCGCKNNTGKKFFVVALFAIEVPIPYHRGLSAATEELTKRNR